jgi:hypothetical protein
MTSLAADALKTDPRGMALLADVLTPASGRRKGPRFAASFAGAQGGAKAKTPAAPTAAPPFEIAFAL